MAALLGRSAFVGVTPNLANAKAHRAPRRAVAVRASSETRVSVETSSRTRAVSAVALFSAFVLAAPHSASAISARLEGTEIAELLASQASSGTKSRAKTNVVVKKTPAPKAAPAVKAAKAVVKKAPAPVAAKRAASTKAPVPVVTPPSPSPNSVSGKSQKPSLVSKKVEAPVPRKGGTGAQLKNEAPKTRLSLILTGGGATAGLGALFSFGKASAAGAGAAKGAAVKTATVATQADLGEALAVLVAGTAVGQTGTAIVTKSSRVRAVRKTPPGELPLPVQTLIALSVPATLVFAILQFLIAL